MEKNLLLSNFLNFKASRHDLSNTFGNDLLNAVGPTMIVSAKHVAFAINQYLSHTITKTEFVDWVNVLWFTDLFEYNDAESDSIASVMTALETLDEDNISFSEQDFQEMKNCLESNKEYHFSTHPYVPHEHIIKINESGSMDRGKETDIK